MGVSSFTPPDPYEPRTRSAKPNASSARDVVRRLVEQLGYHDASGVIPFVQEWPAIVGLDNAAHSRIADFRHGAVVVEVDHPAWLQRMHLERERYVRLIRERFPTLHVRYVHFRVVSELSTRRAPSSSGAVPEPAADSPVQLDEHASVEPKAPRIRDPEILERLERIRRAVEARQAGSPVKPPRDER